MRMRRNIVLSVSIGISFVWSGSSHADSEPVIPPVHKQDSGPPTQLPAVTVTGSRPAVGSTPGTLNGNQISGGYGSPHDYSGGGDYREPEFDNNDARTNRDCKEESDNPVIFSSGTKFKTEVDFQTHHLYPLELVRTYNKGYAGQGIFGQRWASNFDTSLGFKLTAAQGGATCSAVPGETSSCVPATGNVDTVTAVRTDGSQYDYTWDSVSSTYKSQQPDADRWVVRNADGTWTLQSKGGVVEKYSAWGFVTSTKDVTGIGWTYTYSSNYLQSATHSSGKTINFG